MNNDAVLIDDDDDVNMDPVVILDEDDEKYNEQTVGVPTVETIDLDDETSVDTTSVDTGGPTDNSNATKVDPKRIDYKKSEESFINNLRNNKLMDKIVKRCINMESATGMPRVIYKTLLPLYRDTENTYKESDLLRTLLKRTYKLLIRDPNHKFLHIKTLCEELKSGGLRKKVPFVTLATNLKNKGTKELTSSSKEINQNPDINQQIHKDNQKTNNTGNRVPKKIKKPKPSKSYIKDRIITQRNTHTDNETADVIELDDSENESVEANCQNNDDQNEIILIEDSNKENHAKNDTLSDDGMDYRLLIPNTQLEVLPIECEVSHNPNEEIIANLEKEMEMYKRLIDQLEEAEVPMTGSLYLSPYYQCSQYKKKVVECYKTICELKGNCKSIVKRREIRLHVAEGHPPGPAKTLEQYLNSTIDRTGAVEFPDFSDVVKCVVESNLTHNLAWNRLQVMEEALALFRQCGQALRKRRQTREYKDLLSLVGDKEHIDDPADNDPVLMAKLEENKLIAKIKEDEILERYVDLENYSFYSRLRTPHTGVTPAFEADKDFSGSDSENEQNIVLPNNKTTPTISIRPEVGEGSTNNINLDLLLAYNTIVTTASRYNECDMEESSERNDVINNNFDVTSTTPSTLNPMLTSLLTNSQDHTGATGNVKLYAIGESSQTNDDICHYHLDTTHNECGKVEISNTEIMINHENSEISSTDINMKIDENAEIPTNTERNDNDVQKTVSLTTNEGVVQNCDSSITADVKVKSEENEKREPLDIQNMLDELGSGFVCQVFDIEDPFLAIEISSDDSTDY